MQASPHHAGGAYLFRYAPELDREEWKEGLTHGSGKK